MGDLINYYSLFISVHANKTVAIVATACCVNLNVDGAAPVPSHGAGVTSGWVMSEGQLPHIGKLSGLGGRSSSLPT